MRLVSSFTIVGGVLEGIGTGWVCGPTQTISTQGQDILKSSRGSYMRNLDWQDRCTIEGLTN